MPGQATWVWGIDVGSSKLAIAAVRFEDYDAAPHVQALHVGTPPGARRLALMRDILATASQQLVRTRPPLVVWVEQPFGKFPKASLDHAVGVTLATLYTVLANLFPHPVSVILTPVPEWKKASGLPGNAGKPAILAHAQQSGYVGEDQDCADAVCIAIGGRNMTAPTEAAAA